MNALDINQLNALSVLVSELRVRTEERAKATHSNFNVFTTVLQAHDEVRLHTRFIHNLLNPKGTHDCGDLFLKLFFETVGEASKGLRDRLYEVRKEAVTDFGQIDLLLESPNFGIAIENKICARDQDRQVARYSEYLKKTHGDNHLLFYLTLDGKASVSDEENTYIRISYRAHILAWLEKCLQVTYSILPINQVLIQYRHVVRELTNQTLEQKSMRQIADHLMSNPNLIRMRSAFNQGVEEVQCMALDLLAEDLLTEIRKIHPAELRADMTDGRFGVDAWGSIRLSPKTGPFAKTKYQIAIEHVAKWDHGIMVGIESKWNNAKLSPEESALLSKLNELLDAECEEYGFHKADPQKARDEEYWPTGWHNLIHPWVLNDDAIADLLDQSKRAKFAEELISKAMIYIQILERLHEVAVQNLLEAE